MKKDKAPAFQLYASDFIMMMAGRTNEEVGIVIRLLCFQWVNDGLPVDMDALEQMVGPRIRELWGRIDKFFVREGDLIFNPEIEKYRQHIKRLSKKRKASGKRGAKVRWNREHSKPDSKDDDKPNGKSDSKTNVDTKSKTKPLHASNIKNQKSKRTLQTPPESDPGPLIVSYEQIISQKLDIAKKKTFIETVSGYTKHEVEAALNELISSKNLSLANLKTILREAG